MKSSIPKMGIRMLAVLVISVLSVGLFSCQSFTPNQAASRHLTDTPEPKIVIERFFLYYIRGVWRSIQGRWEGAASDFEMSMKKEKHGRDQDRRWVFTYGMHPLFDFFPNRELGICKYRLEKYLEARYYLRKSMSQEPSERARHYLELTHREILLERIDRGVEVPAPVDLKIHGFEIDGDILPARKITYLPSAVVKIVGRAKSRHGIRAIEVNGQEIYLRPTQNGELRNELEFSVPLELLPGKHNIVIKAINQSDSAVTDHRQIFIDMVYPSISFAPLSDPSLRLNDANDFLKMVVDDDLELRSVFVNGIEVKNTRGGTRFTYCLPLTSSVVTVRAEDMSGNVSKFSSSTSDLLKLQVSHREYNPTLLYAAAKEISLPSRVTDVIRPELRLYPPIPSRHVVNGNRFVLDFEAVDAGGIQKIELQLNNHMEKVDFKSEPVLQLRRPSKINLVEGENRLRLSVWDAKENKQQHEYTIVSQPAADSRCDIRLGVKIIPPTLNRIRAREQARAANNRRMPKNLNVFGWFTHSLINQFPPRLLIFNREPIALKAIQEERWFARFAEGYERLCSGQQEVDWVFTGYYTPWSGKDNWDLTITVIDRRSGQRVMIQNMHFTGFDQQEIKTRMHWLGQKFRQALPIHKRSLLQQKGKHVGIDLGKQHGLREGMHFAFLPKDDEFGPPKRTDDNELITAVVTEVSDNYSQAEIYPKKGKRKVSSTDLVVVR